MDPNDQKKTACYDIDVEVEDPLKSQMSSFLLSTANQQEIASLDNKVGPRVGPLVVGRGITPSLCLRAFCCSFTSASLRSSLRPKQEITLLKKCT